MSRHVLCTLEDLPHGAVRVFEVGGFRVAAARAGDAVFALEDRCSHDDGELGAGTLHEDGEIECPRHGGRFDIRSGKATQMPAIAPIEVFPTAIEDGVIYVEVPEW